MYNHTICGAETSGPKYNTWRVSAWVVKGNGIGCAREASRLVLVRHHICHACLAPHHGVALISAWRGTRAASVKDPPDMWGKQLASFLPTARCEDITVRVYKCRNARRRASTPHPHSKPQSRPGLSLRDRVASPQEVYASDHRAVASLRLRVHPVETQLNTGCSRRQGAGAIGMQYDWG